MEQGVRVMVRLSVSLIMAVALVAGTPMYVGVLARALKGAPLSQFDYARFVVQI